MDETYINIYLTSALPARQPVVVLAGILKKHTFTTVSKPLHRICRKCGCMSRVLSGKYKKIHCCSEKPTYLCIRNNKTKIITIKKNAVKKHLAAVVKFLMFISPVYPMVAQGMKEA